MERRRVGTAAQGPLVAVGSGVQRVGFERSGVGNASWAPRQREASRIHPGRHPPGALWDAAPHPRT